MDHKARFPHLPELAPKSFTFIPALVHDNRILLAANSEYRANLQVQTLVEQERLLKGNWKIRPEAGKIFNRAWFAVAQATGYYHRAVQFSSERTNPDASGQAARSIRITNVSNVSSGLNMPRKYSCVCCCHAQRLLQSCPMMFLPEFICAADGSVWRPL